jgi:uncharacterized protein HemX
MQDFPDDLHRVIRRTGRQPTLLAAAALLLVLVGIGFTVLWRSYSGTSPEQDRINASRLLQARTAQVSEQLVEKTKGLETTQQESIDQLQAMQDQLQSMKRILFAQQADSKRLSDQVAGLTSSIDNLRQSFASAQTPEASTLASSRKTHAHARVHAIKRQSAATHRKPDKKQG